MSCPFSWPEIEQKSGVTKEESELINSAQIFDKVGEKGIRKMSEKFYDLVYNDNERLSTGVYLRDAFSSTTKAMAIAHQQEFFIQKLGGPNLYSQRTGSRHTGLIKRHVPYPVTREAADRWLFHMRTALSGLSEWDPISVETVMKFCMFQAEVIMAGRELMNPSVYIGYSGMVVETSSE
mmetsp:Transcript_9799/g.9892  ORF Transcript_9799/g.9892 Transcript_9799/m.9892 type:complete len:179 (+) Transcript_9799:171-707(+)|eukprot:CAMPEP_0182425134 /NCGR_PEP_ID=MMETSP1167-20130531/11483_1 /TAXON_ID=2988 /ORGANISM="Mallomonas Sp, Strain CCMP3275" /LENGTH=178 /DNA_ID=CAMNT_0024605535 /DNA_START=143 /DNA_END=679 /DNA_ORIENTATION=-